MAAYIIAEITVIEPEGFERYRQAVSAVVAAHGGRYLVRGGPVLDLAGEAPQARLVILEFPDLEHVTAFYGSADYAPLRALRESCSTARIRAVEGYQP